MAVTQTGSIQNFTPAVGQSGTVSSTITVPADAQLVLAGFSSWNNSGNATHYSAGSATFTKGGVDTAMTLVDTNASCNPSVGWAAPLFYLVSPDTGANKTLKWSWSAGGSYDAGYLVSVTFWTGLDTASPVRSAKGGQSGASTPYTTSTLTAQSGDLIVAWVGAFVGSGEGSINSWSNLTLLSNLTHQLSADGAWATGSPTGNTTVAASTDTGLDDGGIAAVVIKPAAGAAATSFPVFQRKRIFIPRNF